MAAKAPPRLFSVLTALWLPATVVLFIYLQLERSVATPVTAWMNRVIQLVR